MRGPFRWTLIAIGALVLLRGGVSIFSFPEREVLYSPQPPLVVCTSESCFASYTLEVGNTGRTEPVDVRVVLRDEVVGGALLRPKARSFGKVDRPFATSAEDGTRAYTLTGVRPGERVELQMVLSVESHEAAPGWSDFLLAVESSAGEVQRGDAGSTTLARILFRLFGW